MWIIRLDLRAWRCQNFKTNRGGHSEAALAVGQKGRFPNLHQRQGRNAGAWRKKGASRQPFKY